jgi:hypothetical protein
MLWGLNANAGEPLDEMSGGEDNWAAEKGNLC